VQKDNDKNDSDYWRIEWLRPSNCRNAFKLWAQGIRRSSLN